MPSTHAPTLTNVVVALAHPRTLCKLPKFPTTVGLALEPAKPFTRMDVGR